MTETKTEWYFIVNPRAGSGKTMSKWVPAEQKLNRLGIPFVTAYTDHKKHAIALAHDAAAEGYRKIMAVGGDGSLHEALCGIVKFCDETGTSTEEFHLGVVPIGSGNDWIKCLNVPNDSSYVIDLIAAESFARMDVVKAVCIGGKVSYMANCGGLGFDSHVCKRVNIQKEGGKRGKLIYLDGLFNALRTVSPIHIKVLADGKEVFSGRALTMAMGNGKYSGSGMIQVPLADNDDGIIDVMILPQQPVGSILTDLLPRLFNGKLMESSKAIFARGRRIDVAPMDDDSDDILELDGEIVGRLPMTLEADGRKINVMHA